MMLAAGTGPAPAGRPVAADVVIGLSTRNRRRYGGDWADLLVDAPHFGMAEALDRSAIEFETLPLARIPERSGMHDRGRTVIVLPNLAAIDDVEASLIRDFVHAGGSLLATGDTGRFNADGTVRDAHPLSEVLGIVDIAPADRLAPITANVGHGFWYGPPLGRLKGPATEQSYLRLEPELARVTDGPHVPREQIVTRNRHEILDGFGDTDLLAFGGIIPPFGVEADREVLLTLVPGFPSMPIEDVYPAPERTRIPGLVVGTFGAGRVAYLAADLDRRYGIDPIPDHRQLLSNIVTWLRHGAGPRASAAGVVMARGATTATGRGVHLLNLTGFDRAAGQRRGIPAARAVHVDASDLKISPGAAVYRTDALSHYRFVEIG